MEGLHRCRKGTPIKKNCTRDASSLSPLYQEPMSDEQQLTSSNAQSATEAVVRGHLLLRTCGHWTATSVRRAAADVAARHRRCVILFLRECEWSPCVVLFPDSGTLAVAGGGSPFVWLLATECMVAGFLASVRGWTSVPLINHRLILDRDK
jgi:hypothetical protein